MLYSHVMMLQRAKIVVLAGLLALTGFAFGAVRPNVASAACGSNPWVEYYQHSAYGGDHKLVCYPTLEPNMNNLTGPCVTSGPFTWDNCVSSLRIGQGLHPWRLCFYEFGNYSASGWAYRANASTSYVGNTFNDQFSSYRWDTNGGDCWN